MFGCHDFQQNNTWHYNIQHNDTQNKVHIRDTQPDKTLIIYCYAECHYAKCCYAQCRGTLF